MRITTILNQVSKYKWFILAIAAISFHFYWNDIRPTKIQAKCATFSQQHLEWRMQMAEQADTLKFYTDQQLDEIFDVAYSKCLKGFGAD